MSGDCDGRTAPVDVDGFSVIHVTPSQAAAHERVGWEEIGRIDVGEGEPIVRMRKPMETR
jgi:hypothetical protein